MRYINLWLIDWLSKTRITLARRGRRSSGVRAISAATCSRVAAQKSTMSCCSCIASAINRSWRDRRSTSDATFCCISLSPSHVVITCSTIYWPWKSVQFLSGAVLMAKKGGPRSPSQRSGCQWPSQMKFLVSVTAHVEWKFTDCMLVLCPKLHILLSMVRHTLATQWRMQFPITSIMNCNIQHWIAVKNLHDESKR